MAARRSYGTGSLYVRTDATGRETWYGQWRANGRQVKRRIGPKRADGRQGRPHPHAGRGRAAAAHGRRAGRAPAARASGSTSPRSARRYLVHAERRGRKPSTRQNIESEVRVHLAPFFGDRALDAIRPEDVARPRDRARGARASSPKTIRNVIGTLSRAVQLRAGAAARLGDREPVRRPRAARGRPRPRRSGS